MPSIDPIPPLRQALQENYHAALAMLADCIERCPEGLWNAGSDSPTFWRTFWRIAFHAAYYSHLYLGQNVSVYQPWPGRPDGNPELWQEPWDVEPYELPADCEVYTKTQLLNYIAYIVSLINSTVNALDLSAQETGIPWYANMSKLSHQFVNLRHLQGHVGQLSEILIAHEVDSDWIGKVS